VSYILDALKKSEQERARGTIPDIKTIHQPRAVEYKKTSHWPYILLIVLLLSAGGLGFWFYQQNLPAVAEPTASGEAVVAGIESQANTPISGSAAAQKREAQRDSNLIAAKDFSDDNSVHTSQDIPEATISSTMKSEIGKSNAGKPNVIFSDEPLTVSEKELKNAEAIDDLAALSDVQIISESEVIADEYSAPVDDKVYDIAELPDSVKRQLPAISFAGHVYSSTQSQRSVMLNGKKMREGQEVTKGLLLEEITVDGVVLRSQGYRFRLGALQDWSFQ